MKRNLVAYVIFALTLPCAAWVGNAAPFTHSLKVAKNAHSGGETTVFNTSVNAFAMPLANLPIAKLRDFTFGNKMFNTNWVEAPASVTSLDGLGPTFNRVSCSGCHLRDGRGRPPRSADEPMNSMLIRLSVLRDGEAVPHPHYGDQLNPFSIGDVPAEGRASIAYEEVAGTFTDGTPYSLRKPRYRFHDLAFGELGDDIMISPRVAPAVHGLGLLEAVPESTIIALSDAEDADGDGISGRPNKVPNEHGQNVLGRFGWKANAANLHVQDMNAALGDIGITNPLHPQQNCPEAQTACAKAVSGGDLEMSGMQMQKLVFYSQTLAPPARRDVDTPQVKRGAKLFEKAKCVSCHTPQLKTGKHAVAQLSHQRIQPFTDLLLHDMGEGLADNRPDAEATGREWRTPPLWGIGLVKTVNKHSNFLHDGRARNLQEAILWHGGEAEAAKEAFRAMPKADRDALIAFLESL